MASKLVLRKELRPIGAVGGGLKLSVLIEAYLQPCIADNLIRTCIGEDDCQKHRSTNNKGAMNAVSLLSQLGLTFVRMPGGPICGSN